MMVPIIQRSITLHFILFAEKSVEDSQRISIISIHCRQTLISFRFTTDIHNNFPAIRIGIKIGFEFDYAIILRNTHPLIMHFQHDKARKGFSTTNCVDSATDIGKRLSVHSSIIRRYTQTIFY